MSVNIRTTLLDVTLRCKTLHYVVRRYHLCNLVSIPGTCSCSYTKCLPSLLTCSEWLSSFTWHNTFGFLQVYSSFHIYSATRLMVITTTYRGRTVETLLQQRQANEHKGSQFAETFVWKCDRVDVYRGILINKCARSPKDDFQFKNE